MSSRLDTLREAGDLGQENLRNAIVVLIFLPIIAFFEAIADFITAGANMLILPLEAMGEALSNLMTAIIGGAADIIGAGAFESAQSIVQGPFGPLSFAVAMGAVIAGAWVFGKYRNLESTPDLIPFSGTDIPFLGDEGDD